MGLKLWGGCCTLSAVGEPLLLLGTRGQSHRWGQTRSCSPLHMCNQPDLPLALLGALSWSSLLAAFWELLVWTRLLPLSSLAKRPQKFRWMKTWMRDTVDTQSTSDEGRFRNTLKGQTTTFL